MPSEMCLQVRRLAVDLPAAWDVTDVLFALVRISRITGILTVWAPAAPASPGCRHHGLGTAEQGMIAEVSLCTTEQSGHAAATSTKGGAEL